MVVVEEEYNKLQEDLSALKNENSSLHAELKRILTKNELLETKTDSLREDNSTLQKQFQELNEIVANLENSEEELKTSMQDLSDKMNENSDDAIGEIIVKMEELRAETRSEIDSILEKMASIETNLKQSPKFGIFSYIKEDDQPIFIRAVDDAVLQEKTFAKINEFLSNTLPPELDKIIKDHPSLAKTYIKNFKKD